VLVKIAQDVDRRVADMSAIERRIHDKRVRSLTLEQPPLPDFSSFHFAFRGRSVERPFPDARRRHSQRVLPFLRPTRTANTSAWPKPHRRSSRDATWYRRSSSSRTRQASRFSFRAGDQRRDPALHAHSTCARFTAFGRNWVFRHLYRGSAGTCRRGTAARAALAVSGRAAHRRQPSLNANPNAPPIPPLPIDEEANHERQGTERPGSAAVVPSGNERPSISSAATNFICWASTAG